MFHNILIAVDGSPDAEQALTEAIDLAESEHTRLTLITAVSKVPATAYGAAGEAVTQLLEDAHVEAEAILRRARVRIPEDVSVTAVLSEEPIRPALCRQIAEGHHDPDRRGPPRSRHDGLPWPRRRSSRAARQRQPLRPAPQPHSRAHRPRGSFAGGTIP